MGDYAAYPEYKASGVEWLAAIPVHWDMAPIKRIGYFQGGSGFPDDEQGLSGEDLAFYKVSDTNLPGNEIYMKWENNSISYATALKLHANVIPVGAVIFPKVGAVLWLNKRRITTKNCCIDNNMMSVAPTGCDTKWLYYWLLGLDLRPFSNPGAVPSINEGQIREIPAPIPPLPEQRAIARFLDHKTAQIDALIAKKEALLARLADKRTALISHAVTKGLDPHAPMKDSGIEWLGEIPEHWEMRRVKFLAGIRYGLGEPPEKLEDGLPFLRATDIYRGSIDGSRVQRVNPDKVPWSRNPSLKAGDILVVRSGAYTGDSAIIPDEWVGSVAGYDMVLTASAANPRYLAYNLLSKHVLQGQIYLAKSRAAQPHLNAEELGDVILAIPTLDEQREIVEQLDAALLETEAQAEKIQQAITRLKDYRTALITHAVTGKIDVRAVPVPEYSMRNETDIEKGAEGDRIINTR